ncbi:MAG TPA: toll/interleukin-1 receptor domain-containing protein [Pyrinomonadaceae bacterium]|jgi:hypothetical protein
MRVTPQACEKSEALVFINYRREDASGYAGRLYEWLSGRFGRERVFMDVSAITPGSDFVKVIEEEVAACEAVLVIIGRQWLDCKADGRRRLDDPRDFVRVEIAAALARDALVIPVLVEGAAVPREQDLPDVLKPLARRHALELSDERWEYDAGRLHDTLEKSLEKRSGGAAGARTSRLLRPDLGRYWRLFPVRLVAGLLLLSAALAPQVRLAYRPEPVSLEETGKFSPAAARLGREVLTIEAPAPDAGGLLLTHVGKAGEIVDLGFERARLDGETLVLFGEQNPPTSPSPIDYVTTRPAPGAPGEPCRTFIRVRAADPRRPPSALHFYQKPAPDAVRAVELKADGGVLVSVDTDMPDEGDGRAPGCGKLLQVAPGFSAPVSGVSTVGVVAEADSGARFSFSPATKNDSLWNGAEGFFQPFAFGKAAPAVLRARAVEVRALGGQASGAAPALGARSVDGGEPLSVESLQVGPDRLQVQVTGVGFLKVNGEDHADPLGRVRRHPLPSLLLAAADAALLAWVVHLLVGRRRPPFS